MLREPCGLMREHSRMMREHSGLMREHRCLMREHGGLMREHGGLMREYCGLMREHSGLMREHGGLMREHGGLMSEHGGLMWEHRSLMREHSGLMREHGSLMREPRGLMRCCQCGLLSADSHKRRCNVFCSDSLSHGIKSIGKLLPGSRQVVFQPLSEHASHMATEARVGTNRVQDFFRQIELKAEAIPVGDSPDCIHEVLKLRAIRHLYFKQDSRATLSLRLSKKN